MITVIDGPLGELLQALPLIRSAFACREHLHGAPSPAPRFSGDRPGGQVVQEIRSHTRLRVGRVLEVAGLPGWLSGEVAGGHPDGEVAGDVV
ncbi:hypothetical protein ACF09G_36925, partial [Streptomyces albogriseolus]|uniref:hypothetical protein n=1 Tax=Streptomyces albogriseolus TaxID=1887 RepID=UPI0036FAA634